MNPMREIRIAKVTLNMGVGEPGEKLELAKELLEKISGTKAVKTKAKKRVPSWGIRPGLEIGVKTTVRGEKAVELLKKLFAAVNNRISASNFDDHGNLSFGIKEYIHIPGMKYDPKYGIVGLDVCVTLERPGYRVKRRRFKSKIGKRHLITKDEAIQFFKDKFGVEIV